MHYERIQLSGHFPGELPVSFVCRGQKHLIGEIVDRWYEGGQSPGRPAMDYFRVRTTAGGEFILRYNRLFDAWAVLVSTRGT